MKLKHKKLNDLIKMAFSAEKAAAFAYQGHADSVSRKEEKTMIHQIEIDEWNHRAEMRKLMIIYDLNPSTWYEWRFHIIGKIISYSCYIIGWFMPFYFAGRLESGNVCEYFRMKQYFNELGITEHDEMLYELGMKEKEHEIYFYQQISSSPMLPIFEKLFSWGAKSTNNIDFSNPLPVNKSGIYCTSSKK